MSSRADLHLHSCYSDQSSEWLLRRVDFPDSYSRPKELYHRLRKDGMAFVTLTDHHRIDGCLEIAHLPGVFISQQVTARFPEDRTRVELLIWGITEAQHREIQALRENIYDLAAYLRAQQLLHAVAHPFYRADDRLRPETIAKLLLLFRHFEGLNGLRDALVSDAATYLLTHLTPEGMTLLADRYNLAPTHERPWEKVLIGGSDDHGGVFPGSAWTQTAQEVATPADFLAAIAAGRCAPGGRGGTPLALSHGLYNTLYHFLHEKFLGNEKESFLTKAFSRFMEGKDPTEFTFADKIGMVAQGVMTGKIFELAKPANASLWKRLSKTVGGADFKGLMAEQTRGIEEPERRAFLMASLFVNQLGYRFFKRFVQQLSSGNLIEAVQEVSTLLPVLLTVSPYVYAFQSQAPSRANMREVCQTLAGGIPDRLRNRKRAWFTDTLDDVNGVATTIGKMVASGQAQGYDITVVTSQTRLSTNDIPIRNFVPIGDFELPEYELQKLSFPPVLEMLDYIHREGFSELIISTPGPVGITALIAAKLLRLRVIGIYHTDFPQYIRILTDDSFLETLTWKFMHGFYSRLDLLYVNSSDYGNAWKARGIAEEKIAILPRGLDTGLFHPSRRNGAFWSARGLDPAHPVLIYVGRISKEKDLDLIAQACERLQAEGVAFNMAFVGEGPFRKELQTRLPRACFTGALHKEELATAYASADLFLFPSTTDTYGNVVVEAHASGVPTIVSDAGGPKDLVQHGETGYITRSLDVADFTTAIRRLLEDAPLREKMGVCARQAVEGQDWNRAFAQFWSLSPE